MKNETVVLEKRTKHPHTSTFEIRNIVRGIHKGQIKVAAFGESENIVKKHLPDYHAPAIFCKKALPLQLFKDLKEHGFVEQLN